MTQHSIQNITKQNNRHILNISKSSQKGGREGRTTRTQKSLLHTITYIKQKTLPSINGRRPGPTDSRRCTFTSHYLQEATDPICFSTHVRCKPVLYYCLLCSHIICARICIALIVLCRSHLLAHLRWSIMHNVCTLFFKRLFSHYLQQV